MKKVLVPTFGIGEIKGPDITGSVMEEHERHLRTRTWDMEQKGAKRALKIWQDRMNSWITLHFRPQKVVVGSPVKPKRNTGRGVKGNRGQLSKEAISDGDLDATNSLCEAADVVVEKVRFGFGIHRI